VLEKWSSCTLGNVLADPEDRWRALADSLRADAVHGDWNALNVLAAFLGGRGPLLEAVDSAEDTCAAQRMQAGAAWADGAGQKVIGTTAVSRTRLR